MTSRPKIIENMGVESFPRADFASTAALSPQSVKEVVVTPLDTYRQWLRAGDRIQTELIAYLPHVQERARVVNEECDEVENAIALVGRILGRSEAPG